ncbi:MAG: 4-hydroxythreonine-4-phosphate dehydrogenase PdxA [Gammaproteobacteria bacterium]|nr:4-hydroxythreonine-4-phosphate dehydrogenase PdxA [Gammaproteobacteria bacterium]NIN62444.1 4-hydroxythreonine-4-phosphate dehydrogenase PdxA [Gammaproteobacteria bacterium]NIO63039.1 4-hydroxythreonine-4-phosphate dehydrogenase PdxA [Gammaproteobacteria bacterium]NIP49014.1 4-hydroxythreonine-4-phosphate dehydrogenase PdxA [Gammaproteobacteria bacterium]NIQ09470.1 4-hydroxythreonine-4-phosphate dehydrogenase PdxA [Gammaproteobacteria bacterium]
MRTDRNCPRIALTPGEPAGIGPDIVVQALQNDLPAEIVVVADPDLLINRARNLGLSLQLTEFSAGNPASPQRAGQLNILPVKHEFASSPGKLDFKDAAYVLETLKTACKGCLDGIYDAMVTAPVHKANINDAGYHFTGHTEYLADLCDEGFPVMLLVNDKLRVALVTTHIPLSCVSQHLTGELVMKVIRTVFNDLRSRFGIADPRILVCGLNPHAGENGHLGSEEIDIIIPALERCRKEGIKLTGPLPADTAFTPENLKHTDVVVSMYHDQGLPVLKAQGFGETVNITLGLPIIRTSVDHGTALELAGTGKASATSLLAAIYHANLLINQQTGSKEDKSSIPVSSR